MFHCLSLNLYQPAWIINAVNIAMCIYAQVWRNKIMLKKSNSFSWVREKSQSQKCSKIRRKSDEKKYNNNNNTHMPYEWNARNQHRNVVSFICTACHYAWLLVLLFLRRSTPSRGPWIARLQFIAYTWAKAKKKKESRTVCTFMKSKKKLCVCI